MSKRKWHSGPPPHVGWFNASYSRDNTFWRWWNGYKWSSAVSEEDNAQEANFLAGQPSIIGMPIEWTTYWPKNARVPRIKP